MFQYEEKMERMLDILYDASIDIDALEEQMMNPAFRDIAGK